MVHPLTAAMFPKDLFHHIAVARSVRRAPSESAGNGSTLIEMLLALAIGTALVAGLAGILSGALATGKDALERNALARDANFAMQRMVHTVNRTRRLVLPLAENPSTAWSESDRDPGVLAVTLDPELDRDADGKMDADNDGDGLIDEDLPDDNNKDGKAGIKGIDDDGDGSIDEHAPDDGSPGWSTAWHKDNNDEDLDWAEELLNGIDDDGDGAIDEDIHGDMDFAWRQQLPQLENDDYDGATDEDWLDIVVYHLVGDTLVERMPDINPSDGNDYTERVIAEGVSQFRVVRTAPANGNAVLVDITLVLANAKGSTTVQTRVRVGAGL